jgi:hypothetical protein
MATPVEIEIAEKKIDDSELINETLTALASIFSGTGNLNIAFERDGVRVDLKQLNSLLKDTGLPTTLMKSNIETDVLNVIGSDDVTANTIRKSLKDLIDQHDTDIAAT